jgi:hypothetical protein
MEPSTVCRLIAERAGTAAGLKESLYPARGLAPKYPGLVVILGESAIQYMSEQSWQVRVRGLLMTGLVNDTKHHVNEVDPLIVKIIDAFSSQPTPFRLVDADGDGSDACILSAFNGGQEIGYGGQVHYGAELFWDVSFRRFFNG